MTIYKIKSIDKEIELELDEETQSLVSQAEKDYITSKTYIDAHEKYIWRAGYKSYHMSTFDRKVALWKDTWKSNISMWLTRSFVDVLVSAIHEKPITFIWTWMNKLGIENKEYILNTLKYCSDVSGFHKQLKKMMRESLITWEIAIRVWFKKTEKTEPIISIVDGNMIEETIEQVPQNIPYASLLPIFNVFPDPYSWPLRYVTERGVIPYKEFIDNFWHLIRYKKNKSPFKKYIQHIVWNENWNVDKSDFGNILNQIHQKKNDELRQQDFYLKNSKSNLDSNSSNINYDDDAELIKDLVEFKITTYQSRIILIANWYPVYVWPNIYWFINYIVESVSGETRFGEWIPYLTKPLEDVWNSFLNNYFDWARSISQPTFVGNKNLMLNDTQLQDWTPWWVIRTEWTDWGNVIYRLDKGWLPDFNIIPLIQQLAQQITWISEYNLWVAAWERTASWALAVTQSSQRRLSPYISNYLDAVSKIAYMWLAMIKKFWVKEQYIYVLDENWNQVEQILKNKNLAWMINLSLQAEWMFGSVNELELQKLISIYQTLAPSWFTASPEIAWEIFKKAWFDPSRFMIEEKKEQIVPDNMSNNETPLENPEASLSDIIQQGVNPQIDLWNKWQWQ